jgi:hypothetical protein
MASLLMHLIIAENYATNNNIDNIDDFVEGNLAPDLVPDKSVSHYSKRSNANYIEQLQNKVNLKDFCKEHTIDNTFDKGYFLHLLTDYIFYKLYLSNSKPLLDVFNIEPLNINQYLYSDYDKIVNPLVDKYAPQRLHLIPSHFLQNKSNGNCQILNHDAIKQIIDFCTQIDLENEYNHIKKYGFLSFDNQ